MPLEHSNTSLKNPVITTLRVNRDKLIATSHTCYTCTCTQKELSLILQSNNANSNLVILDFTLLRTQKHFHWIGSLFIYYWLSQTPATSIFSLISPESLKQGVQLYTCTYAELYIILESKSIFAWIYRMS